MNIGITMATFYPLRKTPACIYTHWKYWLKMAQQYSWLVLKVNTELYLAQWLFFPFSQFRSLHAMLISELLLGFRIISWRMYSVTEFGPIVVKSFVASGFDCKWTLSRGYSARSPSTEMALVKIFQETNRDCTIIITGTFITIFIGLIKDQWKLKQWTTPEFSTFSSEIVIYQ